MLGNPRQVGIDRQPGSVRIGIAAGTLLPFCPQPPALPAADQPFLTERIDVSEVPGGTPLDERHHLTRDQVRQAVEGNIDPRQRSR